MHCAEKWFERLRSPVPQRKQRAKFLEDYFHMPTGGHAPPTPAPAGGSGAASAASAPSSAAAAGVAQAQVAARASATAGAPEIASAPLKGKQGRFVDGSRPGDSIGPLHGEATQVCRRHDVRATLGPCLRLVQRVAQSGAVNRPCGPDY